MTPADILDTLAPLLGGIPIAGPFIAAGLGLAARVARAGLTPEHITRIDVAKLRELEADADSRLDARAAEHDRGIPPSDRTPDRRATIPVDDAQEYEP